MRAEASSCNAWRWRSNNKKSHCLLKIKTQQKPDWVYQKKHYSAKWRMRALQHGVSAAEARVYLGQLRRGKESRVLHQNRDALCPCGELTPAFSLSALQSFFQRINGAAPLFQCLQCSYSPSLCVSKEGRCPQLVVQMLPCGECIWRYGNQWLGSAPCFIREVRKSWMKPKQPISWPGNAQIQGQTPVFGKVTKKNNTVWACSQN